MVDLRYEQLTGTSDIRLLKLEPGQGADPLVSSLIIKSLDDHSSLWAALSYTWGSTHDYMHLICDGLQLPITKNLHSALQRLRLLNEPLLLWADAICINQADNEEKEAQVQLMRRIYARANLVVADLGEAGNDYEDVNTIFDALLRITRTTAAHEQIESERYEIFGLPVDTDRKWESWRRFLARPWFRRLWVMQEYALASKVDMMYGTSYVHGEVLPGLLPQIFDRGLTPRIIPGAESYKQQHNANLNCAAMSAMLSARQDIQADRSRGLLHHLRYLASFCEVTDERDKVYALLGLATDAERSALYISYSESTAQVYHRTAKVLVEQGSGIEVLYEAACYAHLTGLPSWAPNWAGERVSESLGWTTGAEGVKTFRATGPTRRTINISADGRLLHVRGIYLDSIEAITEPFVGEPTSFDSVLGRFNSLNRLWDFQHASRALVQEYSNTVRYPPGEGVANAFWRTLICDMTKDVAGNLTRPAPSNVASSFLACGDLEKFMASTHFTELGAARRDNPETLAKLFADTQPFFSAFEPMAQDRRFCVTVDGYMGLVPKTAAKGDGICVFLGGAVPFVIRKADSGHYCLVGECYVHGLMDGKALDVVLDVDWMEEGDITLE